MTADRAIFWDFDATLGYRDGKWTRTLHDLMSRSGLTVDYNELRPYLALGFPWDEGGTPHEILFSGRSWWEYMEEYFAGVCGRFGCTAVLAREIAGSVRGEYLRPDKWFLYDDTLPVLEYFCGRGIPQYIISNHVPELPLLADRLGLSPFISGIACSALVGFEKPSPEIYRYAKEIAGNPRIAIMIGDSYRADVAGALRAGFDAILVRGDNPKKYPRYCLSLDGVPALAETILCR